MTLEDMQNVWSEMTEKMENQKRLTDKLILEMTQVKFKNKISSIAKFESGGAIICFIAALFLALNLSKLDVWYLMTSGIIVLLYLIFVPFMVLRSVNRMNAINLAQNSFKQSLVDFTRRKKHFFLLQRVGIVLNFVLMVLILPVFSKIFNDKNVFTDGSDLWYWYLPIMILFLVPFSIWGYRSYIRITASAHKLLEDLSAP